MNITFAKGRPYTPLMQLLNVLPSQSGPFLPEPYRDLMVRVYFCHLGCPLCFWLSLSDSSLRVLVRTQNHVTNLQPLTTIKTQNKQVREDSPLRQFYPPDFETDRNGKQNTWCARAPIENLISFLLS